MTDDDIESIGAAPNEDPPVYTGPERRKDDLARISWEARMHKENTKRFEEIEKRQDAFAKSLQANTDATHRIEQNTKDLVAIFQGGRQGIRLGLRIGKWLSLLARWLLPILGVIGFVWGALHGKWGGQ